jgi:hypothetical protein
VALVIGYNLAFDLARLAADWREVKKGKNVGAWRLILWTYREPPCDDRATLAPRRGYSRRMASV